ncbi:MAG TPA: L-threonylcarbamoyladenylate synthase [Pyrinomonadaceae bacterium]|jgi:L-threonylcarbamoyladenylate synthase
MIVDDKESARERAAQVITAGGVLAFRTDTFYGLGADPFNEKALASIKSLKGREEGKPILVVLSDAEEAERFIAGRSEIFEKVCARHWPGPLTVVVRAGKEVPDALTAGTKTIGLRLPDDERVREFVRICGGALTATSANLSGEPPARTAHEVSRSFPEGLDLIVDGGTARGERPSTVLDLSGRLPRLLREGALSKSELEKTFALLNQEFDAREA